MNTFELIRNSVDRDIMVYDNDSNRLYKRLFAILKVVAKRNNVEINRFIIDPSSKEEIEVWFFDKLSSIGQNIPEKLNNLHILGIPVFFEEGLAPYDGEETYLKYYASFLGTYPRSCDSLVIAAGEYGAILGTYRS